MGHEGVGIIDTIHPSIQGQGFKIGDAVGCAYYLDCCLECEGCQTHSMFCETGKQRVQGFSTDGFFAEYAVEEVQNLVKLPTSFDLSRAAPIFCAGITAFHAIDGCELQAGRWLAVIGCGGLGQLACRYGIAFGAKVIGIDVDDEALELVESFGVHATFNSKTPHYLDDLKTLTNGGVHAAAVFSDAAAAYAAAPAVVRINGIVMCGMCIPVNE